METSNDGGTVICSLCEEEYPKTETKLVYGNEVYKLCHACSEEYIQALEKIDRQLSQTKVKKLKTWLKERRAVKRFYKRQLVLPIKEGN